MVCLLNFNYSAKKLDSRDLLTDQRKSKTTPHGWWPYSRQAFWFGLGRPGVLSQPGLGGYASNLDARWVDQFCHTQDILLLTELSSVTLAINRIQSTLHSMMRCSNDAYVNKNDKKRQIALHVTGDISGRWDGRLIIGIEWFHLKKFTDDVNPLKH